MTIQDLAVTMGLFVAVVLLALAFATIAFVKWDRREKARRARQIERARSNPAEFEEISHD